MKILTLTNQPGTTLRNTKAITVALSIALFGSFSAHAGESMQTVADATTSTGQSAESIRSEMQSLSKRMAGLARQLRESGGEASQTSTVFKVASDGSVETVDHFSTVERFTAGAGDEALREGVRLGLVLMSQANGGVTIAAVTPGSGAEKAGIQAADELISLHGAVLPTANKLSATREILRTLKQDEQIKVGVKRGSATLNFTVTAAKAPTIMTVLNLDRLNDLSQISTQIANSELQSLSPEIQAEIATAVGNALKLAPTGTASSGQTRQIIRIKLPGGVTNSDLDLTTLNPDLAQYFGARDGVLALDVKGYPPLLAGDVITRIDGNPTATPSAVFAALSKKAGQTSQVEVIRQKSNRTLSVQVPTLAVPPAPPAPPRG